MIPLFPLNHVLLPGMPLPLHIFEQRYRDLLADVTATRGTATRGTASFGVVALRSGTEAITPHTRNSGPDVERVGTIAEILELEPNPNGTFELLSVGSRRFRVVALVPDGKPYLRAEVEYLGERDGDIEPADLARARELFTLYVAILARLGGRLADDELPSDANRLSYQIAARLPLPPAERQALLSDATAADRLHRVAGSLRRELALLQRTRSVAVSPAVLRMLTGAN